MLSELSAEHRFLHPFASVNISRDLGAQKENLGSLRRQVHHYLSVARQEPVLIVLIKQSDRRYLC